MQEYKCPMCGAVLKWDPKIGKLRCPYCDSRYDAADFEDKTKNVTASEIKPEEKDKEFSQSRRMDDEWVVYSCGTCGAEVVASKTTMATVCAYCGSAISITSKAVDNFRPKKIIPYFISKDKAIDIYRQYAQSSEYIPDTFLANATIEKMQNLFVPFYMNSMRIEADASVESRMVEKVRSGNDEIVITKKYHTLLKSYGQIQNVPTDASKKMENDMMDALEPFDYGHIKDFNPAYMAGYVAEQPDEFPEDMLARAEQRVTNYVDSEMLENVSFLDKRIIGRNYKFLNEQSEYTMLPIWVLNIRYENKLYRMAINGETGKIVGELPIDYKKLKKDCRKPCYIISAIAAVLGVLIYLGGLLL